MASLSGGLLASGSAGNTVRVWEVESGRLVRALAGHTGTVRALAGLPGGLVASGSVDMTVRVWEVESGRLVRTLAGHGRSHGINWVMALVSLNLPGGLLASGSTDMTVRVWEAESGRLVQTLAGHTNWVMALASLPGGHRSNLSRPGSVRSHIEPRPRSDLAQIHDTPLIWALAVAAITARTFPASSSSPSCPQPRIVIRNPAAADIVGLQAPKR